VSDYRFQFIRVLCSLLKQKSPMGQSKSKSSESVPVPVCYSQVHDLLIAIFPGQPIPLIILDYLNPLHGFCNDVFDVVIRYDLGRDSSILSMKIDPNKNICKYDNNTCSIKTKATVSATQTNANYDEVENYSNPQTNGVLLNELCDVNVRCVDARIKKVINYYNERRRYGKYGKNEDEFNLNSFLRSEQPNEKKEEESEQEIWCVEISLELSKQVPLGQSSTYEKYLKSVIVVPAHWILDFWMNKEKQNEPIICNGTWLNGEHWNLKNGKVSESDIKQRVVTMERRIRDLSEYMLTDPRYYLG